MKIKSITDVITNSSSEVFIISLSDPLYEKIKNITEFIEVRNLDSLKDFVLSKDYCGFDYMFDDVKEIGNPVYDLPRYDVFEDYSEIERTLENWEKYKDLYKGLLGVAFTRLGYDSPEIKEIDDILFEDHFRKDLLPVIQGLVPGERYTSDLEIDNQEISFLWTGEDNITVEGPKFNAFQTDIKTS